MKYLNDKSEAGLERWMLASRAFEHHDPTRRFAALNPMVHEHWLSTTEAILKMIYEAAASQDKRIQRRHRQEHLAEKAG
jgi:hypothetical protein